MSAHHLLRYRRVLEDFQKIGRECNNSEHGRLHHIAESAIRNLLDALVDRERMIIRLTNDNRRLKNARHQQQHQ